MTNKKFMKETAQIALKEQYGFAPALNKIILLEGSDDRTYIRFMVGLHEYRFDSYQFPPTSGSVWCGEGTITQVR